MLRWSLRCGTTIDSVLAIERDVRLLFVDSAPLERGTTYCASFLYLAIYTFLIPVNLVAPNYALPAQKIKETQCKKSAGHYFVLYQN